MKYTMTFRETDYAALTSHLFVDRTVERAAYALCRVSSTDSEIRLLVTEVMLVTEDVLEATATGMSIANVSFLRAMKNADQSGRTFVFIHSHPEGYPSHSARDDEEEKELFSLAYRRVRTAGPHASIVFSSADMPVGRVWLKDGVTAPIEKIRVIGSSFKFYNQGVGSTVPISFFDRQVRAFGVDIQRVLGGLCVGVVGAGGTGSAVIEQLARLGIGRIAIFDGQTFEETNVNRVYGSSVSDKGVPKVLIAKGNCDAIGLGTLVEETESQITYEEVARKLRNCDIIFGCTDDEWGRSILSRLAVYYAIPVFDMGVKIHSEDGQIKSVQGRVTTLLPDEACLYCRGRISAAKIQAEMMSELDPDGLGRLQREGYAQELEDTAPAVIPFTTTVASLAVTELLNRLTGFMGNDRVSNEVIVSFDNTRLNTNRRRPLDGCFCGSTEDIMRGDTNPFLDITWR